MVFLSDIWVCVSDISMSADQHVQCELDSIAENSLLIVTLWVSMKSYMLCYSAKLLMVESWIVVISASDAN